MMTHQGGWTCDCDRCLAAVGDSGGMPHVPEDLDDETPVQVIGEMDRVVEHAYKRERDAALRAAEELARDRDELRREVVVLQRKLAEQQREIERMRGAR